jgi:hypothetical protein
VTDHEGGRDGETRHERGEPRSSEALRIGPPHHTPNVPTPREAACGI